MSANRNKCDEENEARLAVQPTEAVRPGAAAALALLVDDQSYARHRCRSALQRLGYEVIALESGAEALSLLPSLGGKLACAVLDLSLSQMEAGALYERLRALSPELPVLLASGVATASALARIAPDTHTAAIEKPYREACLAALLDRLLAAAPGLHQA